MKEYPVLVVPLSNNLDEYETCFNCGSNVVRVLNRWAVLTEEGGKEFCGVRTALYDLEMICAICGESIGGYQLVDDVFVVESLKDFGTLAAAKEALADVLDDEEVERQKGKGMVS